MQSCWRMKEEGFREPHVTISIAVKDPWGNGLCFVDDRTLFTGI